MLRFTPILLCAAAALAQAPKEPPQPPAAVDQALRARVLEFFQYHVTGEFRKAEALVAEDSKDLFYNRNKPRYIKFNRIERIDYNADFTKATAIVSVVSPELIAGWDGGPPTLPIPSTWKLENGKWCWYLEPEQFLRTPFGTISLKTAREGAVNSPGQMPSSIFPAGTAPAGTVVPGAPVPASEAAASSQPAPAPPPAPPSVQPAPDPAALAAIAGARQLGMSAAGIPGGAPEETLHKIKPDRTEVALTAGKSEKVTFASSAADGRSLLLLGALPGITARLDRTEIVPGGTAVLTLEAATDAKGGTLNVVIPQTGELVQIRVTVK